jgi:hypothetical protein
MIYRNTIILYSIRASSGILSYNILLKMFSFTLKFLAVQFCLFEAYFFLTLIRCNSTTENNPELSLDINRLKKKCYVHSSLEVDFTETLKLKYETKPPKLSSHGEEDELAV